MVDDAKQQQPPQQGQPSSPPPKQQQRQTSDKTPELFLYNQLFPDAAAVFSFTPKPLRTIRDSANVVLDTSVLLVPFGVASEKITSIRSVYEKLAKEKRLLVPGQAAREFARNRARSIAEVYDEVDRRRTSARTLEGGNAPILSSSDQYQKAVARFSMRSTARSRNTKTIWGKPWSRFAIGRGTTR
jgi:hypothetical protein